MSGELFAVPTMKSPRLKWIEKHRLKFNRTQFAVGDECPETGSELWPVYAYDREDKQHGGATEDDALAAWAKARGVRLWFEEGMA